MASNDQGTGSDEPKLSLETGVKETGVKERSVKERGVKMSAPCLKR